VPARSLEENRASLDCAVPCQAN